MLKPMASCIVSISRRTARGIPLVCLHTSGSDGRQWRHLLADEEFAKKFRIIAFDTPWHGKSNPPANWTGEDYRLLHLLTGEYDFSCTPEDTMRTAAAINGASVTIMEQLGHFR